MRDYLVRGMTMDGFVKVVAIRSTNMVSRAAQIHGTTPNATAALENTPISVSAAWLLRLRTNENRSAKTTENMTAAQVGAAMPQMHPIAIPVKAE